MLSNRPRSPRRRRLILISLLATAVIGGGGVSVAVGLVGAGQGPFGETLPAAGTGAFTPPDVSGPEVSEAAAVAVAAKEASLDNAANSNAATQEAPAPQAVALTTRKTATEAIGQGAEPANADAEVAAWYGGAAYIVSFVGEYAARDAPVPPGANTPTGQYLTMIVDAYSGKITGFELSKTNNVTQKVAEIAKGR